MKKHIRYVITVTLLSTIVIIMTIPSSAVSHLKGDTDCNGEIEIVDATKIQRVLVGLISDDDGSIHRYGDLDGNGLTIMDATLIQYYLAQLKNEYHIGEAYEYEDPADPIIENGKITFGDISFDVSKVPDQLVINNSSAVSKYLILYQTGDVVPEDVSICVNNDLYDYYTDYSDERFKENYLKVNDNKPAIGYDCLVRNEKGEEAAWVCAHYEAGYKYPYRATVFGLKCDKCSFPIEFRYKGYLLKKCIVTIDLDSNKPIIESTLTEVHKIEKACWTDTMTDQEKMKAFAKYVADHYTYSQVMCVDGAVYTAFAARDLGLTSMLLYPGGEENQTCGRHIITYNLYFNTVVPGGHCACLTDYPDGSTLRYDVQGGSYWIRNYNNP